MCICIHESTNNPSGREKLKPQLKHTPPCTHRPAHNASRACVTKLHNPPHPFGTLRAETKQHFSLRPLLDRIQGNLSRYLTSAARLSWPDLNPWMCLEACLRTPVSTFAAFAESSTCVNTGVWNKVKRVRPQRPKGGVDGKTWGGRYLKLINLHAQIDRISLYERGGYHDLVTVFHIAEGSPRTTAAVQYTARSPVRLFTGF